MSFTLVLTAMVVTPVIYVAPARELSVLIGCETIAGSDLRANRLLITREPPRSAVSSWQPVVAINYSADFNNWED